VKERLRKIAKWVLYPLFYLFCLALFGYLTFPFDRLKDRLIAEFEHAQTKRGQPTGQRLEIDELSSYWFTGVEATGVRLILPPEESKPGFDSAGMAKAALATMGGAPAEAPKETVIKIDEAHGRLQILPLLIGRLKISFWASAFGGEIEGMIPVGAASGPVEVELENVDLGQVEPLVQMIGLPLKGTAAGKLSLVASEGKFNKANGAFELTVVDASIGDGKTKWKGQLALPEAKLGDITITAEATAGALKITKLASTGPDVELIGDGKTQVREPWNDSVADLYMRFKFSDAYRDKNDDTRSLLGSPGSSMPALIEIIEPKVKRAKRPDGFYGFHVHGPLKKLKFDPSTVDAPGGTKSPRSTKASDSPFSTPKKSTPQFPLGTSQAGSEEPAAGDAPQRPATAPAPEPTRPEREEPTPPPAEPAPPQGAPGPAESE
jgi:type II secretion system protein N